MKWYKSLISMIICLIMFSNTAVFALEIPIKESIVQDKQSNVDKFIYPKKIKIQPKKIKQQSTDLRLPQTVESVDEEELQYGEPIAISEHEKVYQVSDNAFKTIMSEIPNTYINGSGKQVEIDNTLVKEHKLFSGDVFKNNAIKST